jgi:phage terminase large subunit-like protein
MAAIAPAPFDYEDLVTESEDLELFREFVGTLQSQQKAKLFLEPFQAASLSDYFCGCTITVIIQPKKNGKSTIVAAVSMYHALTVDDADVIIVANSKDQAKIVYRHIVKFIAKQPELQSVFDVKTGFNEIRVIGGTGRIRVLASDDQTLEGVEPTLVIIDEYGQFTSADAWGPLNDGLDTRKGQMIVISNAGTDEEGPLGTQRTRLYEYGVERHGLAYRVCRAPDGSEVLHEWALDSPEQCEDLSLVSEANPASWMTLAILARRKTTAETKSRWYRMGCGLWVRGGGSAIQPWEWDGMLSGDRIPSGANVFVGLDFGWKHDCTAVVPHHWTADGKRLFGTPIILEPPAAEGKDLDSRAVTAALEVIGGFTKFDRTKFVAELSQDNDREDIDRWADAIEAADSYSVSAFIYDPYGVEQMMQDFHRKHRGITIVPFSQKDTNTSRADGRFMEALRNKLLGHNGHTEFRAHALNAIEVPTFGGREFKFDHPKSHSKPMDALRAASMAHDAAVAQGGTGPAKRPRRVMRVVR